MSDPLQRGVAWKALLRASQALRVRVYVPTVVLTEAVAGYARNVEEMRVNVLGVQTKWEGKHVIAPSLEAVVTELDAISAKYESDLRARLRRAHVSILPIPPAKHRDLVQRAANRRKPSDTHGNGYRDTLNWLSVLDLAQKESDPVVWVTANTRDFAAEDGIEFHPDLKTELEILSLHEIVSMSNSLDELELPRVVGDEAFDDMDDVQLELMMSDEVLSQFHSPAFLAKIRVRDEDVAISARRGRVSLVEMLQSDTLATHLRTVGEGTATGTFTLKAKFRVEYREDSAESEGARAALQSVLVDLVIEGQIALTPGDYSQVDIAQVSIAPARSLVDSYLKLADWAAQGLIGYPSTADLTSMFANAMPDIGSIIVPEGILKSIADINVLGDALKPIQSVAAWNLAIESLRVFQAHPIPPMLPGVETGLKGVQSGQPATEEEPDEEDGSGNEDNEPPATPAQ